MKYVTLTKIYQEKWVNTLEKEEIMQLSSSIINLDSFDSEFYKVELG